MRFRKADIPDIIIIEPEVFSDDRGFFMETFQAEKFNAAGINVNFVQDNHSKSIKGALRGLHYQIPHSQGKLVRVIHGEIFDVAVDLRKSSPYFKKWYGIILNELNKLQLWIPQGFAHGFYTVSNTAEVLYKTTDFYNPTAEKCIRWNDPTLKINWPFPNNSLPLLSARDSKADLFSSAILFD